MSAIIQPAAESALGSFVHDKGVAFRVWAPNADAVSVVGSFNGWDPDANPCERNDDGTWYANVRAAEAGSEYQFHLTTGKKKFTKIDPRARQVTNSVGNGVVVDSQFDWGDDQKFQMPYWNELIIYELHVGTFNAVGDGVGTFESAGERLGYLKKIGINAIELMPIAEFAGDYSWGYNPAHPFAIETAYGGAEALKRFIKLAHQHGIAVIIDVVYNHFGPSDLDLWQFDGWSENDKGGIYFYNDYRSSTPWGDTRPDYGRGEVRQYIFDNAMMWLDEYHADGLRYDMTLYMRSVDGNDDTSIEAGFSLTRWINEEIQNRYPGKITIAEDLRNNALITAKAADGGANFSSQWDAQFVHPIRRVITEIDDANRSMAEVKAAIEQRYNIDAFARVVYTESHDEVANGKQRVVSEIDSDDELGRYAIKRSTLGAALMMTVPGIPMWLQGQEFLRDKWFDDGRPIDWSRADKYDGIVTMYTDLANLRRNRDGTTAGLSGQHVEVFHVNDADKVIAFRRWKEGGPGDDCVIVMNFAEGRQDDYQLELPIEGSWKLRFNSDREDYNEQLDGTKSLNLHCGTSDTGDDCNLVNLSIGAYACLIYSQDG